MKLTNKYNLPQTFVNVLQRDPYTKGKANLSVTEMINSPRIVMLTKQYGDQLVEDVTDRIWSLFGTAVHNVLEKGKADNHVVEQRLFAEMDGWHISGAIDLQVVDPDGITINDWKVTSVWAVMNEKPEWEQQLNIYAWLIEKIKKVPVKKLEIVAILKDWKSRETKQDYPESQVKVVDIPLWTNEQRESFIKERISLHSNAFFSSEIGEPLPLCTPSEMWETQTTYAVKKVGNKRATAICQTLEEAQEKVSADKNLEIEERKGERRRCADYCIVNQFCNQYQDYLKEKS